MLEKKNNIELSDSRSVLQEEIPQDDKAEEEEEEAPESFREPSLIDFNAMDSLFEQ